MDTLRAAAPGGQRVIVCLPNGDALRSTRDELKALTGNNQVTAEFPLVDGFAATVDEKGLDLLEKRHARVVPDETLHLQEPDVEPSLHTTLDIATQTLKCQDLWSRGITGKGVTIAVLDSGIAPHPDFVGRIVAFEDLVNGKSEPYDDRGHGTHVAGICAGSGKVSGGRYKGAAPDANLAGIKVFDAKGNTDLSHVLHGIQWAVDNRERFNIKVLNISFGTPAHLCVKNDPVAQAVSAATRAGLLVVCAAGNSGPWPNTIDSPADSPDALTVGATVDYKTPTLEDDKVAWFSGSGPTVPDGFIKPDVIAPGQEIVSTWPNGRYVILSGTSMATPLVSGVAAMMFQLDPKMSPTQMKDVLMKSAHPIRSYDANVQGRGVIWPVAAVAVVTGQSPA